ncbi:MAG: GNAT family N-acetyltransferase [Clostridiales bacterium]|nr:GNAT family N-acetyltransferase [Clostridiales bacterium]
MPDMLVKLYDLPPIGEVEREMAEKNIVIRKPIGPENYYVMNWITEHFSRTWASEAENAFFNNPKTIYIACREGNDGKNKMLGFACYDATVRGFFGPTGVAEDERRQGIGRALLIYSLYGLRDLGYGYAIIGSPGPIDFYKKSCGATVIEGSEPGVYKGMFYS